MSIDIGALIVSLLIGAVAGWLAGLVMGSKGGLLRNIIMGVAGGFVGRFLFGLLNISLPLAPLLSNIIIAAVGACVVILVGQIIFK